MRVFQIGFNKCGTSALFRMFKRGGIAALHSGGRYWRRMDHPAIKGRNPQLDIQNNILEGRPALAGLEDFQAFFDMEYVIDLGQPVVENYRYYRVFADDYPDAKFILNLRDKAAWLRSRARHRDGDYLQMAMDRFDLDRERVLEMWAADFDNHHAAVRRFFADTPDRLIEYDIDNDTPDKLVAFFAPQIKLKANDWKQVRVTDHVAQVRNWTTALAL